MYDGACVCSRGELRAEKRVPIEEGNRLCLSVCLLGRRAVHRRACVGYHACYKKSVRLAESLTHLAERVFIVEENRVS